MAQTPAQDIETAMQGALGAQVLEGCSSELTQYCAEVTPGEGRLLACLYAHGDKLSGPCEFALYDAAARLERAINAITYVASECRAELENALCERGSRARARRAVPEGPRERAEPRLRSGAGQRRREMTDAQALSQANEPRQPKR